MDKKKKMFKGRRETEDAHKEKDEMEVYFFYFRSIL